MIRDPSDGSVRPQKSAPVVNGSLPSGESDPPVKMDCAGADTGLSPEPKKPKDIAKLERSRLWLKSYKERK